MNELPGNESLVHPQLRPELASSATGGTCVRPELAQPTVAYGAWSSAGTKPPVRIAKHVRLDLEHRHGGSRGCFYGSRLTRPVAGKPSLIV
jgi:hypothetical protein